MTVGLDVEEEAEQSGEAVTERRSAAMLFLSEFEGVEGTYSPVTVKAVQALYSLQTMIPDSVFQLTIRHRWPSVHPVFQVRKLRPRIQRTESAALLIRLYLGGRVRKK